MGQGRPQNPEGADATEVQCAWELGIVLQTNMEVGVQLIVRQTRAEFSDPFMLAVAPPYYCTTATVPRPPIPSPTSTPTCVPKDMVGGKKW